MYRTVLTFALLGAVLPCLAAEAEENEIHGWGVATDPDGNCEFDLKKKKLSILAPGPAHDLSAELQRMNAPRVLRKVKGNFVAVVRVLGTFNPGEATIPVRTAYNGAGLLLMASDRTYIRLERATLARSGRQEHYANFELRKDGEVERIGTPADYEIDPAKVTYLRIERKGDKILGAVTQEPGKWHKLESKTVKLPDDVLVGVATINASTRPFTSTFECLSIVKPEAPSEH